MRCFVSPSQRLVACESTLDGVRPKKFWNCHFGAICGRTRDVLICSTVACAARGRRRAPKGGGTRTQPVKTNDVDVLDLAHDTVLRFVEKDGYPVIRELTFVEQSEDEELLVPGIPGPPDRSLGPHNWAPLQSPDEAHRLFYKLALGGHCSEVSYLYLELFNSVKRQGTHRLVFRGQKIRDMKLCVGFVAHKYRKLRLAGDFGMNYWQHSQEVHCGARNHVWLEFSTFGNNGGFVLDLTGIQFDMTGSKDVKYVHVCQASDPEYKNYEKCYDISSKQMPIHFLHWGMPRAMSAKSVLGMAARTNWWRPDPEGIIAMSLAPDLLDVSDLSVIEVFEAVCELSRADVIKLEIAAARKMESRLGVRNPYDSQPNDGCSLM